LGFSAAATGYAGRGGGEQQPQHLAPIRCAGQILSGSVEAGGAVQRGHVGLSDAAILP
jgi:hypothetical protein